MRVASSISSVAKSAARASKKCSHRADLALGLDVVGEDDAPQRALPQLAEDAEALVEGSRVGVVGHARRVARAT